MKKLMRNTLLAGAALAMTAPGLAQAGEFTPAQRGEIGGIVRDYLLKHPDILIEMSRKLEEKKQAEQAKAAKSGIAENADAIYHGKNDLVVGDTSSKVAMVEFFDYNCGFCKRALPDVLKLKDTNKDLKIIIKEFPILGPGSMEASRYALASRKQGMDKYWKYHVAMLGHKGRVDGKVALALAKRVGLDVEKLKKDAKSKDVNDIINANMAVAAALNINGTPAFIIGETIVPGALGYKTLNHIIGQVRKSGCKHC